MGTAPGEYPPARPSGSCPGWAATGLAAVTLAIRVSSAVPPLLAAIVARAYGRRGCRCAQGAPASPQGESPSAQGEGARRRFFSTPRLLDSSTTLVFAVLPSPPLPLHQVAGEPDQVRGTFREAAHEVVVPVRAIGGGDEDSVTGPSELDLVLWPHAVEHLKFEAVGANAVAPSEIDDMVDDLFIMSRDRGEAAVAQHAFRQLDVGAVDVRLARVGDARWLQIGPLHQPEIRRERQETLEIGRGAIEVRLQNGADVVMPIAPKAAIDPQRVVDPSRFLHVDADEVAMRCGVCDDVGHV